MRRPFKGATELIRLLFHLLFLYFLFLGPQLTCNGAVVPGKYEVRVDASHLRFTFRPQRALNPMQPGQRSAQPAYGQPTASSRQAPASHSKKATSDSCCCFTCDCCWFNCFS